MILRLDKKIDTVFDDQMKLLMVSELFEDWIQNEIQDYKDSLEESQELEATYIKEIKKL